MEMFEMVITLMVLLAIYAVFGTIRSFWQGYVDSVRREESEIKSKEG